MFKLANKLKKDGAGDNKAPAKPFVMRDKLLVKGECVAERSNGSDAIVLRRDSPD